METLDQELSQCTSNESTEDIDEVGHCQEMDGRSTVEIWFSTITLVCIILLGVSGNTLVLAAIKRERGLHNKTSILMANLAIADLLNSGLCMVTILVSCVYNEWIFGYNVCVVVGALTVILCSASINTLAAIALDRYFAIVYPFRYAEFMSTRRIVAILIWIWTQPLIFSLMPIFGWSQYIYISNEYICTADWSKESYTVAVILIIVGLPILIMAYSYAHIFRIASAHRKQIQSQQQCNNTMQVNVGMGNQKATVALTKRAKQMRRDTKAATTLLIVMGTFLLCWLPHTVTMICLAIPSCNIPDGFYVASTWFAMLNSACNPFIYCITNKHLREAFKRTLAQMLPTSWKRSATTRVAPGTGAMNTRGEEAATNYISVIEMGHNEHNNVNTSSSN